MSAWFAQCPGFASRLPSRHRLLGLCLLLAGAVLLTPANSAGQTGPSLPRANQDATLRQLFDQAQGAPLDKARVGQLLSALPKVRALAADAKVLAPKGQNTSLNAMVRGLTDSVFAPRFRDLLIGEGFASPEAFLQAAQRLFVAYASIKQQPDLAAMRAKTIADFENKLRDSDLSEARKQRARDQYLPAVEIYFNRLMNNPDLAVVAPLTAEIDATIAAMEQAQRSY
jgi:hypothetical protein|tara:strand:- start:272 stop:952 length:681 start_codon:yes stop_codon:yes gene_type:complete